MATKREAAVAGGTGTAGASGESWESSVSWDGSDGKREGRRCRRGGVRVGDIGELEHGRMVSEKRRRKPHVVVHLDIEW